MGPPISKGISPDLMPGCKAAPSAQSDLFSHLGPEELKLHGQYYGQQQDAACLLYTSDAADE